MTTILLFAAMLAPECHSVTGESILGRDLAAVDSRFSAIPEDATLGYTSAPGARRVFHAAELARLAVRYGMPPDAFEQACFDRPLQPIDQQRLLEALRSSLAMAEARIEITESSLYPAPAGEFVFPRSGLGAPLNGVALWKGYVKYGAARRFPIWARVKIQVEVSRVVAIGDLRAGVAITASQVRLETVEGFPAFAPAAKSVAEVVGQVLHRGVAAGSVVPLSTLQVNRGENVTVEARAGAARLEFEARAESAGRIGETVSVLNAVSKKRFRAQVTGKGKVSVSDE